MTESLSNEAPAPARWQILMQRVAAVPAVSAALALFLHHLDRPLMRASGGRLSLVGLLTGLPTLLLTTVGARSGVRRTTPLVYLGVSRHIVLIASSFGRPHHPAWYYNLRAHPHAEILCPGRTGPYVAREASDAEREAYWPRAVTLYHGYATYGERAHRRIPMLILSPGAAEAFGTSPNP